MKKNKVLVMHIFVILISLLLFNVLSDDMIKFKEVYLLLIYAYTMYTANIFVDYINSYMIFLYTLGLFNFSRIALDLLEYARIGWATKFANYYFCTSVVNEIIYVFLICLLIIHLGFLIAIKTSKLDFDITIKRDEVNIQFSKIVFIVFSFMLAIKLFIQFKAILAYGYNAYYTGILRNIEYPSYTYSSGTIMTIAFIIFLVSKPEKSEFLIFSSIYLLVKLLDSLKGAWAIFLTQFLFIFWYYVKAYKPKIRYRDLFKIFGFILAFSQILVSFREKKLFSLKIITSIENFFFSQGVSYLVLGYTIDLKERIANKLYIIQGIFGFKPQGQEALNTTNSLPDVLTYMLDPKAYIKGEGIGSNFIAESYFLGYFLMIILFVILGYLIVKYEIYVGKYRILLMLSTYLIPNLFYIPRGSLFGGGLLKFIGIYILVPLIIMKGLNLWKEYLELPTTSG